jgi:uncharacterized protein (DUF433 family)
MSGARAPSTAPAPGYTASTGKRSPLAVTTNMLTEAEKMRRVPGIVFADGPTGRRPRIEGTGLEVFEIIYAYRGLDERWEALKKWFHWLSDAQLEAALTYARTFPDDIDPVVRRMERFDIEAVYRKHPKMRPPAPRA